jgi:hypothetical protein
MKDRAPRDIEINGRYAWYVVGVLMFAYIVSFIDRLILGLLIQPIKQSLQVSDIEMGLLAGIGFALFYTVMGIPLARLADSGNRWCIAVDVDDGREFARRIVHAPLDRAHRCRRRRSHADACGDVHDRRLFQS